jgi:hypothetical protein
MSLRHLPLLLVLACKPIDNTDNTDDTDDTDVIDPDAGPTFGRLYDAPMSLVWGWSEQETEGVCVDLKIATNGADVDAWQLNVEIDKEVDELQFVTDIDARFDGTTLTLLPSITPELGTDEELLASFCADPGVRLLSMEAVVTYHVEPVEPEPADLLPLPYETMFGPEGTYAVEYASDGVENGGECLRVHVINLIDEPMVDWAIELTMDADTVPTYTEGLRFYAAASDVLIVLPDADSRMIQPFDDEVGRVCLEPLALPIGTRIGAAPEP